MRRWKQARYPIRICAAVFISMLLTSCASDKILQKRLVNCPPVTNKEFDETMRELVGLTLTPKNRVTELVNGEQFFPAMLEAICGAQQTIHFENFVWRSGKVSTQFIEALAERARAGVEVRFLVDALGAGKLTGEDLGILTAAGVEVAKYNQPGLTDFWAFNHRTHRKTLVVDGRIGFVGGISIADEWLCETGNPGRWRDSNYRVEGPMVSQLERIFSVNWSQAAAASFEIETQFIDESFEGYEAACFMSGPGEGAETARRIYLLSIAAAQESIRLAHSYFLPDNLAIELLIAARKRGVKVEILTPGVVNLNFVRRASRSRWQKLLDAGVVFYEYQPTKYHLKLMIVDDVWVTAGSINFDARSFRINDEANFIARDRVFAATQIATFEADKLLSHRVEPEKFEQRPWWTKASEHFYGLFRSQL